ncbi:alpha/beta hydrolase [Pseudooceanicola sp. LIPI14-2-Ac024]|uniref:alpha/beta hydrolase n=1 Tax=Pseudooceanicola sp. LIPI14-2-Ac024 TaxID=3344875 RepID=UPI0035D086E5
MIRCNVNAALRFLLVAVVPTMMATPLPAGGTTVCDEEALAREMIAPDGFGLADVYPLMSGDVPVRPERAEAWASEVIAGMFPESNGTRSLVVHVHGFDTEGPKARCQGILIKRSLDTTGDARPDAALISFVWPSKRVGWPWVTNFSNRQGAATIAAMPLSRLLLAAIRDNRVGEIVVIAHSLGAQVAMDALDNLARAGIAPGGVDAVILVQGAIPAVSIRAWSGTMEVRHPAYEQWCLVRDDFRCKPPIVVEHGSGAGRYFGSSLVAGTLIVTTANYDRTLWHAFGTDELHMPSDQSRPQTTPRPGRILSGGEVRSLAIGNPFPEGNAYNIFAPVMMPDITGGRGMGAEFGAGAIPLAPPDPLDVMEQTTITYAFDLQHPRYHEIPLEGLPKPDDWHSPLATDATREALLAEVWRIIAAARGE